MIFLLCLLLFASLACSAFLSASETALFSLSPLTLKAYKNSPDPKLSSLAQMMERPRDVLVTLLIFNVLANLLVQNIVSSLFSTVSSWGLKVGIPLALTLVFGEVLPKSMAMPRHKAIACRVSPAVGALTKRIAPLRRPLTKATEAISRFFFFFLRKEKAISADELRHVLKTSKETGVLLPQECDLIRGCLNLQDTPVKEYARPREDIVFYSLQEPLETLKHLFVDLEVSRIPVCRERLDDLLGILSARSFFLYQHKVSVPEDLLPILKKPYYAPESMKAWNLLGSLREIGESLAMIVDEYGSISGLASQEDLIETVIGEISDKRDAEKLYTRSSEDVVIASGKLELSLFAQIFGRTLESKENSATLGGWLIEQLGDIPAAGTKYATDQFLFYVLEAEPHRVRRIYVRRLNGAGS